MVDLPPQQLVLGAKRVNALNLKEAFTGPCVIIQTLSLFTDLRLDTFEPLNVVKR